MTFVKRLRMTFDNKYFQNLDIIKLTDQRLDTTQGGAKSDRVEFSYLITCTFILDCISSSRRKQKFTRKFHHKCLCWSGRKEAYIWVSLSMGTCHMEKLDQF